MKITLDDPRLTAYALDELDGAERETIEAELENYDECQREVEEITRTAALLSAELAAEPLPQLTYGQQMAIEAKLQPGASKSESVSPRAALQTQFPVSPLKRLRSRAAIFAAAATVATGICLGVLHFFSGGPGTTAFAQTVQQIQNAKSITWKVTYYEYYASSQEAYREGRKSLRTGNQLYAYKAPGLYRKEDLDDNGQVWLVIITDVVHMRELSLFPKSKTARLSEIASAPYDTQGPFSGYLKELQAVNLQWVETRKTVTSEINIFRRAFNDNVGGRHSYDFWIDAKSKRLVEVHVPGVDLYDPDKDPVRNNPPGYVSFGGESPGYFVHDIAYGAELDQ